MSTRLLKRHTSRTTNLLKCACGTIGSTSPYIVTINELSRRVSCFNVVQMGMAVCGARKPQHKFRNCLFSMYLLMPASTMGGGVTKIIDQRGQV